MQLCSNKYSVTFGLKNNSEVSKKVLKNVEPELKKDINNGPKIYLGTIPLKIYIGEHQIQGFNLH